MNTTANTTATLSNLILVTKSTATGSRRAQRNLFTPLEVSAAWYLKNENTYDVTVAKA